MTTDFLADIRAVASTAPGVVPRIRVARVRDLPPGAVRVFGQVIWRNRYGYRSQYGLARVPGAEDPWAPWEYEGRIAKAGADHAFHHPEVTRCKVRYMTRYECQETWWRVLTGDLTPALEHHKPLVSIPEIIGLKGRVLACTCPVPASGPDWCHASLMAWLAATHSVAALRCVSAEAAKAVAREADRPGTHRAVPIVNIVYISYVDKRYPLDTATWAAENDCATDAAAGSLIGEL
jgi:hypothetical protein